MSERVELWGIIDGDGMIDHHTLSRDKVMSRAYWMMFNHDIFVDDCVLAAGLAWEERKGDARCVRVKIVEDCDE